MSYFDTARTEILPYLPQRCERVLDLGCGTGATLGLIREQRSVGFAGGVELDLEAAKTARERYDHVWTGRLEAVDFAEKIAPDSLDLVLCLDILEHLADPWAIVRTLTPLLTPGGRLILSVPNIRNWKFIVNLLVKGDFRYRDAGLLDRTHLRFFVRETAIELACVGGLHLVGCHDAHRYGPMEVRRMLNAVTFGRTAPLIAKQWIVVAERQG